MFAATTRQPGIQENGEGLGCQVKFTVSELHICNFSHPLLSLPRVSLPTNPSGNVSIQTVVSLEHFLPRKLPAPSSGLSWRSLYISLGCECWLDNMIFSFLFCEHTKSELGYFLYLSVLLTSQEEHRF